jgi:hypothetical protein
MKQDTMNAGERVRNLINGKNIDRLPVLLLLFAKVQICKILWYM